MKGRSRSMSGNVCGWRSARRMKNGHDVLGFAASVVAVYMVGREGIVGELWWMQRRGDAGDGAQMVWGRCVGGHVGGVVRRGGMAG